jgi:hypothetical protein
MLDDHVIDEGIEVEGRFRSLRLRAGDWPPCHTIVKQRREIPAAPFGTF